MVLAILFQKAQKRKIQHLMSVSKNKGSNMISSKGDYFSNIMKR